MGFVDERDVSKLLTDEQLRRGACGIAYRAEQLAGAAALSRLPSLITKAQLRTISNMRIESMLANGRSVAYFLRERYKPGDLHYTHYSLTAWTQPSGFDDLATEIDHAASSHLSHASTGSKGITPHPGEWALNELAVVLVRALADFVDTLTSKHPESGALFRPSPRESYTDLAVTNPLSEPTPVSKHPIVGGLTEKLQTYLRIEGSRETQRRDPCDPSIVLVE